MPDLFSQLMQRHMGSQEPQPGTPAPPSAAVGMFSQYQPPPPNRPQGWTSGPSQPPQGGPTQQNQVIGGGPGAATPPGPQPPPMPTGGVVPGGPPMPPNPPKGVPPQGKRFANAQMMQDSYRNGWQPNPILLQALLNKG
jgi:hypothetical protein